jgi:hypothetical protein
MNDADSIGAIWAPAISPPGIHEAAARLRDPAMTRDDLSDAPKGKVISAGTVFVGD